MHALSISIDVQVQYIAGVDDCFMPIAPLISFAPNFPWPLRQLACYNKDDDRN